MCVYVFIFALVSWNLVISSMIKVCGLHLDTLAISYIAETKQAVERQHFLELFVTVFFGERGVVPGYCMLCHTSACYIRKSLATLLLMPTLKKEVVKKPFFF